MLNAWPAASGTSSARTHASATSSTKTHCMSAVAAVGQQDRPAVAQSVPEELLAIERLPRSVDKRRPEGHDRQARLGVQAEESALGHRLVLNVRTGTSSGASGSSSRRSSPAPYAAMLDMNT